MENKPQTVFEKIDKQDEKLDDIALKLDGMNVDDLYALAKRTWNYGDFETAKKYYTYISILRPLDWEAPLYASLCRFKIPNEIDFWEDGLNFALKILVSSINYIDELSYHIDKKREEMTKCIDIIKTFISDIKKIYFKNKKVFDEYLPDFVCRIDSFYLDLYNINLSNEYESLNSLKDFIVVERNDLIQKTTLSQGNTNDKTCSLQREQSNSSEKLMTKQNILKKIKNNDLLINEIKLKGSMYFEYSDKTLFKRNYYKKMIISSVLIFLFICGIIVSFIGEKKWILIFILSMIIGLMLIIQAITQKNKIKCSSLFLPNRKRNRLSSDGNIINENGFNFISVISKIIVYTLIFVSVFIIFNTDNQPLLWLFIILDFINLIISIIALRYMNQHVNYLAGRYFYYYKDERHYL